jgi:hypothetical protein
MPGSTVNRGYPYSLPADPADVPQAIEDLARAIDTDMQALIDSVIPRPLAKVSAKSATKQVFPADQLTELTFDFLDYDNAGISNLSVSPTRLTPTSAGVWMVWVTIEVPSYPTRSHDLLVRANGTDIGRATQHLNNPTGGPQMMTVASMSFMDGVDDYFTATFQPDQGTQDPKIGNKSMACFRLTNS